jgi:hypothetical protein
VVPGARTYRRRRRPGVRRLPAASATTVREHCTSRRTS